LDDRLDGGVPDVGEVVDGDLLAGQLPRRLDVGVAGNDDGSEVVVCSGGAVAVGDDLHVQALVVGDHERDEVGEGEVVAAGLHARDDGGSAAGGLDVQVQPLVGEEA